MNKEETTQKIQIDKISRILMTRMLFIIIFYPIIGVFVYWIAIIVYLNLGFHRNMSISSIVHWLESYKFQIAVLYILVGYLIILIHYWKKPFSYLTEILNATELIYENNDSLIELSPSLQAVELQMNRTKITVRNNERATRDAEQRKNDLVAYLAHDLKTPITSVIGYLTLLRDENKISDDLRERYLTISLNKAERLDELINEFFEITRFNLSHIELEYEYINLTRMLEQLIYEFKPMLDEKNLTCELIARIDIMINCDSDKLQRVFDNLLRNGINYSFENNVIQISVTEQDSRIIILFENKGNPIPKEKLERIFERFYRLDSARSSKSGGAGLGLAIAKEIVESHGGNISAYGKEETNCFEVVLPLN